MYIAGLGHNKNPIFPTAIKIKIKHKGNKTHASKDKLRFNAEDVIILVVLIPYIAQSDCPRVKSSNILDAEILFSSFTARRHVKKCKISIKQTDGKDENPIKSLDKGTTCLILKTLECKNHKHLYNGLKWQITSGYPFSSDGKKRASKFLNL